MNDWRAVAAGDVRTAAALAAPGRLMLHNTGRYRTAWAERLYTRQCSSANLTVSPTKASASDIISFALE